MVLLQISANFAQGPFQGYVPDLVPAKQVGLASALVGLFQVLGNAAGFGIGVGGGRDDNFFLGMMALGALELVTMISVVWRVNEGKAARDRGGRSWLSVGREAWATDILQERSFLWLVGSRLFFLMGATMLINLSLFYFAQTFGLTRTEAGGAELPGPRRRHRRQRPDGHPGRADLRPGRPEARDLRGLRGRRRRAC